MQTPSLGWKASAKAWVEGQGETGDMSRRVILDPALENIFKNVEGLKILDLGCGEGRYARVLAKKGAIVSGIDPVEEFIDIATSRHPEGDYTQGFAEFLPYPNTTFDIVLSYLTIIDILDYKAAIAEMARVLKPKGQIVIVTMSNFASCSDGWVKDAEGKRLHRPVDRYMEEFTMDLSWGGISIQNYHRPLSTLLHEFFKKGMVLTGFEEPLPKPDDPEYESEFRAPNFQIMTLAYR